MDIFLPMGRKKKSGGTDPTFAALAFLGIDLGCRPIKSLSKDEINAAFTKQLHMSEKT